MVFSKPEYLSPINRHTFLVGLITKSWACIETSLDISAARCFVFLDGDQIRRDIPRGLRSKTKFIRKTLKASTAAKGYHNSADKLLECVIEAMDFRHDCVHGVLFQDGQENFPYKLHKVLWQPDTIHLRNSHVREEDMNNAIREAFFLIGGAHILAHRLEASIDPRLLKEAGIETPKSRESVSLFRTDLSQYNPTTKRAKRAYAAIQELADSLDDLDNVE